MTRIKRVALAVFVALSLGVIVTGPGPSTIPVAVAQQPAERGRAASQLQEKQTDARFETLDEQIRSFREQKERIDEQAARLSQKLADLEKTIREMRDQQRDSNEPAEGPANANAGPKVLTPAQAIQQRPKDKVTVRFKAAAVQDTSQSPGSGFGTGSILLKDGSSFSVRVVPPAMNTIRRLDIDPVQHFTGKFVRATGFVQADATGASFQIKVEDLEQSQLSFTKE